MALKLTKNGHFLSNLPLIQPRENTKCLKINCPGYLTVSRYTFWDNFFFDEISIIQVILRYMSHPQFTSSQIGPLFNPILYDISNN